MTELSVSTAEREQWIDITAMIQDAVAKSGVGSGLCVVYVPHTTAGVTIQENADPDVVRDCLMALKRMVPDDLPFRHSEGNSTAHVKTVITGSSATIPVRDGRLSLGTWQAIYFCEYDGPRHRRVSVDVTGAITNG
jgi:secondary thiamine-phosphate synthase enzyme